MKRTTIVTTLGPASSDAESIEKLVRAGMSVACLNFSHGTHEEHRERLVGFSPDVSQSKDFPGLFSWR
jgi:pyruvate kinase